MGVVTGAVGGIIRDTLGHVPSVILRREIYMTASVLGAGTYVLLNAFGAGRLPSMIATFVVTFGGRWPGPQVRVVLAELPGARLETTRRPKVLRVKEHGPSPSPADRRTVTIATSGA